MTRSDLLKLIRLFHRRRWLMAAVALTTLLVVIAVVLITPVYYRATATIMPSEAAVHNPLSMGPVALGDGPRLDHNDQQSNLAVFMGLAKSPAVLKQASEEVGNGISPERLAKLLDIAPAYGAAFTITAFQRDPSEAIRVANQVAQVLATYYREESRNQAFEQRRRLDERVTKLRATMESSQDQVSQLRAEEVSLPTATEGGNPLLARNTALQAELDSVRTQLNEASERRQRTEHELAHQPGSTTAVTSTTETPLTDALQAELARIEQDLLAARARFTDKHREVQRLVERREQVKARLSDIMGQMATQKTVSPNPLRAALQADLVRVRIDEAALGARARALETIIKANDQKARQTSGKSVEMAASTADFQAAQEAYRQVSGLLQAVIMEQQAQRGTNSLQVVQQAVTAEGPAPLRGPDKQELLVLGIFLSLVLGVGAGIAAESLDGSLRSAEEVQEVLQLPLSATIPEVMGAERKALPQITRALPISPYAECYRFLRSSILSNGHRQTVRSLMVTSASPAQGSTTTIANLALSLAEAGRRVILVDADLRRPMQHIIFGVDNATGLTSVLGGKVEVERAIKPTDVDHLFLLTAGPAAENPSALLHSDRMRETVRWLRERFEYVLVDTPPVLAFSDSMAISSLIDGALLVVRVGDSSRGNELQAKLALERAGATILGVVVNGLSPQQIDSFHFHAHYYQQPALPSRGEGFTDAQ